MIDPKRLRSTKQAPPPERVVMTPCPEPSTSRRDMTVVDCARISQLARMAMADDFMSFLKRCMSEICPAEVFKKNWHHDAISFVLEDIYRNGSTQRQIFCLPPRSLKSIMISVAYVAWLLGKHPAMKIMCISYSKTLATYHARDCRRIMQAAWYQEVFPQTKLVRSTEDHIVTSQNGGRYATSVGGSLTGLGADVIIVDDPIKPDDANSETARAKCIEWFRTVLGTRLNDKTKGVMVLVMQRVHVDDLAGYLIDTGDWDVLELPAETEEPRCYQTGADLFHTFSAGQTLHPEHEPLHELRRQRRSMGSAAYSAQYLQRPVPVRGNLIQADWLKATPRDFVLKDTDRIVISWDCALEAGVLNDYSVGIVAAVRRNQVYILDVVRERLLYPDLKRRVIELARRYHAKVLLIENAAHGAAVIQALNREAPGGVPTAQAVKAKGDKVTRLSAVSAQIEAGDLFLPAEAAWLAAFKSELMSFPDGRHDDQVDALSQLLDWVARHRLLWVAPLPGVVLKPAFGSGMVDHPDYDPDDPDLSPDFYSPWEPMC